MQKLHLRIESSRPSRSRLGTGWGWSCAALIVACVGIHFYALGSSRSPEVLAMMTPEVVTPPSAAYWASDTIHGADFDALAPDTDHFTLRLPSSFQLPSSPFAGLPDSTEADLTDTLLALNFGL